MYILHVLCARPALHNGVRVGESLSGTIFFGRFDILFCSLSSYHRVMDMISHGRSPTSPVPWRCWQRPAARPQTNIPDLRLHLHPMNPEPALEWDSDPGGKQSPHVVEN